MEEIEQVLAPWRTNGYVIGEEGWFEEEFERALNDLDPKASVGLSIMRAYGSDVGTALGWDAVSQTYDPNRVWVLREATRARMRAPEAPDDILVFIKPEPHKLEKIKDERFRLISAVSLVDTMVDRIMFGWLHRAVMSSVGQTPCLIGWTPYNGGYRYLTYRHAGEEVLCIDKSSWDWTVPGWLLVMVRELIEALCPGAPQWWREWFRRRWISLFRDAIFQFQNGVRVQQPGWGVMKSGCYLTILINCLGQMILHALACMRLGIPFDWMWFHCVGDDTAQRPVKDLRAYIAIMENLGFVIKEMMQGKEFEFCGHRIASGRCVPAYTGKHVFKILTAPEAMLPDILAAYQWAYAHDDKVWDWLSRLLLGIAPSKFRDRWTCLKMLRG